jgi:plasmid stabilization system protein ParE
MNYRIIVTHQARQDLKDISKIIAKDKPLVARRFVSGLKKYFDDRLRYFPFSGRQIERNVGMLTYKKHIILYDASEGEKTVKILHIFAGGRNWEECL